MPKRLIICLDGTWNSTANEVKREDGTRVLKPTNPLKTARAILPQDSKGNPQVTYYDIGVGALGAYSGLSNQMLAVFDRALGGAFGAGFEGNVEQAATFLSNNYSAGAEVFVFGFSRGAAQARALTNFLSWMGGIPAKKDAYYIPILFRHYLDTQGEGLPTAIKDSNGDVPVSRIVPVEIKFLGIWDTVLALGSRLVAPLEQSMAARFFHVGTTPAACVQHARQALALDEERFDFRAEVFTGPHPCATPDRTLAQRWFCGVHGNVGGSYGKDGLANIALHWIVGEAKAQGLEVDDNFLKPYQPYFGHELGVSKTRLYKFIDWLRFTTKTGRRTINGHPEKACLSFDRSVMQRFCSDPTKHDGMDGHYRPPEIIEIVRSYQSRKDDFYRDYELDPEDFPFPDNI